MTRDGADADTGMIIYGHDCVDGTFPWAEACTSVARELAKKPAEASAGKLQRLQARVNQRQAEAGAAGRLAQDLHS